MEVICAYGWVTDRPKRTLSVQLKSGTSFLGEYHHSHHYMSGGFVPCGGSDRPEPTSWVFVRLFVRRIWSVILRAIRGSKMEAILH